MKLFDRVLDYSAFSCRVTGNTEHLPHGIDTSVFHPYDRIESKRQFRELGFQNLNDDDFLVGIVATNQPRKDWALGIQTCRILLDRGVNVKVWCHVDVLDRHWSLPNLIADYGLGGRVTITDANFKDEQLAKFYSACDLTLSIGLGEGFGYPTYEALACGTPVVAGDYCGSEWLNPNLLVSPKAYRYEGPYSCKRPIYDPEDWAALAEAFNPWDTAPFLAVDFPLPAELDWKNLWPKWQQWFMEGLQ
jgi:glycosyltransferase involved in cell wall biosynthesis